MFRIFALCSILISLCFGLYKNELAQFDKNFIISKKDTQLQFHQQLKSFYIQSVINEDEKNKIELLKRLIISSNVLNLDDSSYAHELEEMGVSKNSINALRKAVVKDIQKTEPQRPPQNTITQRSKQDLSKLANAQRTLHILNSRKIDQRIVLDLNTNLNPNALKSFTLDERGNFRHITDFEGVLQGGRREYKFHDYRIVISQYNPKTIRIVAYAKEKISIGFTVEDKKIIISKIMQAKQKNDSIVKNSKSTPANRSQAVQSNTTLYVLDVNKLSNSVVLKLNRKLQKKDISSFSIKDGNIYRQVLSFEGVLEGSRRNFSFGRNTITVTQYNPKIVRVVLNSPREFKLFEQLDDRSLTLGFSNQANKQTSNQTNRQASKQASKQGSLNSNFKSNKLIVLDAGHGGKDSGSLSDKKGTLKEKDVVLSATLKLGNELKRRGYKVFYTRISDQFINLRDRTKYANDKKADLFISIHANAAPDASKAKSSQGVETFFLSPARSERSKRVAEKENQGDFKEINYFSKQSILNFLNREKIVASNKLAIDVQKHILTQTRKKYNIVDGGVREAPFWVLVGAQMPAILIEIGYLTHPTEGRRIASKNFQNILVKGIADGIESYFYNNR